MREKLRSPYVLSKLSEIDGNSNLNNQNIRFFENYKRFLQDISTVEIKDRVSRNKYLRSTILNIDLFEDMKGQALLEYVEDERETLVNTIKVIDKELYLLEKIHKSLSFRDT